MRILQINSVYGFGSTGRIVENLHKGIIESGHESYVIYGRGKKSKDNNIFKIGLKFEHVIDLLGTRLLNKHAQFNYLNTKMIIKKIKEIKPDIVHLHNIHGYYVNFEELISYLKKSEIKILWLLHDTWLISGSSAERGGLEYDWQNEIDLDGLKKISNEYPKHSKFSVLQSYKNYKIKKKLLFDSEITFVTPSKWLANIINESYLHNHLITIIPNGVDLKQFHILEQKSKTNKKLILGVANIWEESKGLAYFNKLAVDLDNNYDITVVGVNDKQTDLLNKRINCIKRTNSIQELVEVYNQADIFVNPTLYDNFPTVNIEAQACGTPVITFDTGGSGESVVDGYTGGIIEKKNYNQLLKKIQCAPKKSKELSYKIREHAKKYSNESMINEYMRLYLSL